MSKKIKNIETLEQEEGASLENNNVWQPIFAILIFLFGIIIAFGSFGYGGMLGNVFFSNAYTLFGLYSYLLPIPLFLSSIILWKNKEIIINQKKLLGYILFYMSTTMTMTIFDHQYAGLLSTTIFNKGVQIVGYIPLSFILLATVYISLILITNKKDFIRFWHKKRTISLSQEVSNEIDQDVKAIKKQNILNRLVNFVLFKNKSTKAIPAHQETKQDSQQYEEDLVTHIDHPTDQMEDLEPVNTKSNVHDEIIKDLYKNSQDAPAINYEQLQNNKIITANEFVMPPVELLDSDSGKPGGGDTGAKMKAIKSTLDTFNIPVEMGSVTVGPSVTRFTLKPAQGVNVRKILNLKDNLQMAVSATSMHIEAPIPGKPFVGIEIPNEKKQQLGLRNMIENDTFENGGNLLVSIGKDIIGNPIYGNIEDMPHLLIAGATKSGKSVTVQNLIISLLYKNSPDDLKLIIIDPKRVEFTMYKNLPHLGTPVIVDAKNAVKCLNWAIGEMERRYQYFADNYIGTQNIQDYNKKIYKPTFEKAKKKSKLKGIDLSQIEIPEKLPFVVIIFDEFNDFMLSYPKEITSAITSLTQKGRAAGIHLVLATQRPDVKVITGTIKANIPARIALKTSSSIDSRTILDQMGAEDLLGKGDMLYTDPNHPRPVRLQAPFVSSEEVSAVIDYIKNQYYDYENKHIDLAKQKIETKIFGNEENTNYSQEDTERGFDQNVEPLNDIEYVKAKNYIIETGRASTSSLQARFGWGYPKAQKFIIMMETHGIIGPLNGNKREILVGTAKLEKEADELIEKNSDNIRNF